jgi:hypothetical protein
VKEPEVEAEKEKELDQEELEKKYLLELMNLQNQALKRIYQMTQDQGDKKK